MLFIEISFDKEVIWDKNNKIIFWHHYGLIWGEEKDSIVTNDFIFMVVGLKKLWFYLIGYFLMNPITDQMLAQLIKGVIHTISDFPLNRNEKNFD